MLTEQIYFEDSIELTGFQKTVVDRLYASVEASIEDVIKDPGVCDSLTIVKVICSIAGSLEMVKHDGKGLKGRDKRIILLYVGRKLIEEHTHEDYLIETMALYETLAPDILEHFVDFAKNNKLIRGVNMCSSSFCC